MVRGALPILLLNLISSTVHFQLGEQSLISATLHKGPCRSELAFVCSIQAEDEGSQKRALRLRVQRLEQELQEARQELQGDQLLEPEVCPTGSC